MCEFSDHIDSSLARSFLIYHHIIEYHILQWLANRAALADRNEQYPWIANGIEGISSYYEDRREG